MVKNEDPKSSARIVGMAALGGFVIGVSGAAAYLFSGGEYLFNVPLWARVVFYPGFLAGYWAAENLHFGIDASKVIGIIAVGLAYAAIAALVFECGSRTAR